LPLTIAGAASGPSHRNIFIFLKSSVSQYSPTTLLLTFPPLFFFFFSSSSRLRVVERVTEAVNLNNSGNHTNLVIWQRVLKGEGDGWDMSLRRVEQCCVRECLKLRQKEEEKRDSPD
jgi:hypothetical protein